MYRVYDEMRMKSSSSTHKNINRTNFECEQLRLCDLIQSTHFQIKSRRCAVEHTRERRVMRSRKSFDLMTRIVENTVKFFEATETELHHCESKISHLI